MVKSIYFMTSYVCNIVDINLTGNTANKELLVKELLGCKQLKLEQIR